MSSAMKPGKIFRVSSMTSKGFGRMLGDPPELGRLERISRSNVFKRGSTSRRSVASSRREKSKRWHQRKMMRYWTILFSSITIAFLVIILAISFYDRRTKGMTNVVEKTVAPVITKKLEWKFQSPSEQDALEIVKKALAARDEGQVADRFRLGSGGPHEVLDFLTKVDSTHGLVSQMSWMGGIYNNSIQIDGVFLRREKNNEMESTLLMMTPNEQGVWKIDFDSMVGKCVPEWDFFVKGEATGGMVRVSLGPDNYFNGPYADESKWLCFALARSDSDQFIFGYCLKNSPQAEAISKIIDNLSMRSKISVKSCRATLRLTRTEGAEPRQYEINGVLAEDWLISENAFDGTTGPLE